MCDLAYTRVLTVERSNEHSRFATGVHFEVNRTHRENRSRTSLQFHIDESRTILHQETGAEGSVDREVNLCCTRMGMRSVHATRAKETNGHGDTIANDGGEVLRGSSDGMASCASRDTRRWCKEVEQILRVVESTDTIHLDSLI